MVQETVTRFVATGTKPEKVVRERVYHRWCFTEWQLIMGMLSDGYSVTEIAEHMRFTFDQIETQIKFMTRHYNVTTRIQLIAHAIRNKIIE